jgi:hypothetical protein
MELVTFFFTSGWHFSGLILMTVIIGAFTHDIVVAARKPSNLRLGTPTHNNKQETE